MSAKNELAALISDKPSTVNPILMFLSNFLGGKGLDKIEEVVSKAQNKGFTDAAFQAMMKEVGWKSGEAWCAYYVKVVLMQFYSFDRDYVNKVFTGSAAGNFYAVRNLNARNDKRYILVTSDDPQVGDVVVWGVIGRGHTGIVTEVINKNSIRSIEGNTSLAGAREGDGVRTLRRSVKVGSNSSEGLKLLGYIRRNFTKQDLEKLYFDETQQTLKLK